MLLTEADTEELTEADALADPVASDTGSPPEKKKRATKKKKDTEPETVNESGADESAKSDNIPADRNADKQTIVPPPAPGKKTVRKRVKAADVLTIESGAKIETERSREDAAWH